MNNKPVTSLPALRVRQWLADWDLIEWRAHENRAKPKHWFYQFSMVASKLKVLSGVYPRTTTDRIDSTEDLGIQRRRDESRSAEIQRFIKSGYPWSALSEAKRNSGEFEDLRQPGWLPTAVVVNILLPKDTRRGKTVSPNDLIRVKDNDDGYANILLPESFNNENWQPDGIHPIEVIDGQHRLWAFAEEELDGDFELPVVAFVGLDLSWQAYLFYTINIKPKKINTSLAFDLYPLLRTEQWLVKFEGHSIYRETRAQELVDLLWSHEESPWYHRINMLGESGNRGLMVTQAAWVRSLMASFIKNWEGHRIKIGGLFGSAVGQHDTVLPWNRAEQAAFLIVIGQLVKDAIRMAEQPWINALRNQNIQESLLSDDDLAFVGHNTLLNQDQGIRTLLQIVNDLCFVRTDYLLLYDWGGMTHEEKDQEPIKVGIQSLLKEERIIGFLTELAENLVTYDWRASSGPGLTDEERTRKAAFRGSGGYRELRQDVLHHLSGCHGAVAESASDVITRLGYK
ncbi:MAG: DGQHR domain-containing protein [Candidatus Poribacteria bacterium]|nr:DGQHR domain-containing protein [Candidatus Poribacteria bacterium]